MKLKIIHSNIRKLEPKATRYDVHDTTLAGFVARVHPSGKISYLLKYTDLTGTRKNHTIGLQGLDGWSPSTARDEAEKLKQKLKTGIDPQTEKKHQKAVESKKKQNTLRSYFEGKYQQHLETNKKSSQAESRRIVFAEFAELLDKPVSDIAPDWVRDWRQRRRKDGLSPHTLKRYNAELDVLLSVAVDHGIIDVHPLKGNLKPVSAPSRDNIKPRFLSETESVKFRKALCDRDMHLKTRAASGRQWLLDRGREAPPSASAEVFHDHLHPMCLISLNTGIRQGELFLLEWQDIEGDYKSLELRKETTKNSQPRSIPLNTEAATALRNWRLQSNGNRLVFPNADGEVFDNCKSAWRSLMTRSKITSFRWHDMRHDFASQLVTRGVPLNTVRELMGHATMEMTLRYAHLSNQSLTNAVQLLNKSVEGGSNA